MIRASAPGKVVLWGEYAVLEGAPAAVLAVNRRATCEIIPGRSGEWRLDAAGYAQGTETLSAEVLLAATAPPAGAGRLLWSVLREPGRAATAALAGGGTIRTDTRAFYRSGVKLGIGSSAAVTTAAHVALCALLGRRPDLGAATAAHNTLQGKRGSGLDVAAAWHGGTLRFEAGTATPFQVPPGAALRFVWTGRPAATGNHIDRFRAWLATADPAPLRALGAAASDLFDSADLLVGLEAYRERLKALDAAAGLGIYGGAHERLDRLADEFRVVYKPCGAGGGDLGMAASADAERLDRFCAAAAAIGLETLHLEAASHGYEVIR